MIEIKNIRDLKFDIEVLNLIKAENLRQMESINLIASENYTSDAVMCALGSIFTNKYAEGTIHNRYYSGCKFVDELESLAIRRLTELFNAESANVQPHSGSQANMAVYFASLCPGDCVLSMSTTNGGHLSHGSLVNFSGELYNFVHYGVDKNGFIDYSYLEYLAKKHKPKMIVCGASAYSRAIDFQKFRMIADNVDALLLVDMAHIAGIVAAGLCQSPIPFADFVTGTTQKTLRGPRGGFILSKKKYSNVINRAVFPGTQGGPLMNVIAAKAVCFKEAAMPEFKNYIEKVLKNASAMASRFRSLGYDVISGGTDTHLFVLDLSKFEITGAKLQRMLDEVNINVSKQAIPDDKFGWSETQGIRIGTPAMTTRGFGISEFIETADLISDLIKDFTSNRQYVIQRVKKLTANFSI